MAIDATVAGAAATSYLTVAAADALAADDLGPEASRWLDAATSVAQREVALKRATREIDEYIRSGFRRYSTTQGLRFPRANDLDTDGDPVLPADVRHATYYQAIFLLSNAAVIDRANARQARNASSASEPDHSYTVANDPSSTWSLRALQALAPYAKASRAVGSGMTSARVASGFAS